MILTGEDRRYDSQDDAALRLYKCIVMYDGYPYYVQDLSKMKALGLDFIGDNNREFDVNDTLLDLTPPHIGYVTPWATKGSFYPMKTPVRKQRQGVDPQQFMYFAPHAASVLPLSADAAVIRSIQKAILFRVPQENPVVRAIEQIKEDRKPFSRSVSTEMALSSTKDKSVFLVWHKSYPLGYFIPKERRWILPEDRMTETRHAHLQSILQKEVHSHEVHSHP